MGNDDPDPPDESTEEALSLPTLGLGLKRHKRKDKRAGQGASDASTAPVEEAPIAEAPVAQAPVEEAPVERAPAQPVAPAPPEPAPEPQPVAEPEPRPEPPPVPRPAVARESVAKSVADLFRRTPADEPTRVEEPAAVGGGWASMTGAAGESGTTEAPRGDPGGRTATRGRRTVPTVGEGGLTGRLVAGLVGALAGLLMVGGTIAVMGGCEVVRGTSTCGGGPGFLLIVALVAVTVVAGAAALRLTGVPYAGLISFLGVGIVVVLVLLFLLPVIYSLLMVVVIPLLASASFVLAQTLAANVGEWSGPEWR